MIKTVLLGLEADVEADSSYIVAMGRSGDENALPFTRLPCDDAEDESMSCRTNELVLPSRLRFMDTPSLLASALNWVVLTSSTTLQMSSRCGDDVADIAELQVSLGGPLEVRPKSSMFQEGTSRLPSAPLAGIVA